MISGTMKMNKIIASIIISFLVATIVRADYLEVNKADLNAVMKQLATVKQSKSEFIETKSISLLDNEIKLSGLLEYTAPNSFIKQTLIPRHELFKVIGNELHIKNAEGGESNLLVSNHPVIEMFVEAYRGILSGNLKKLTEFYTIKFKGNSKRWHISLIPIEEEALEYIEVITVEGQGATISKILTLEASGDKSIMHITNK